jgi:hypothetical protein
MTTLGASVGGTVAAGALLQAISMRAMVSKMMGRMLFRREILFDISFSLGEGFMRTDEWNVALEIIGFINIGGASVP